MRRRPRLIAQLGVALALGAGAVGCSGGDERGPFMRSLDQIPEGYLEIADDGSTSLFEVRFADIARASELAGFDPPAPDRSEDDFVEDFALLTSPSDPDRPFIVRPRSIFDGAFVEMDAVEAEIGFSFAAVESFSESPGIPIPVISMSGELSLGGELVEDGDIWVAGSGPELEFDIEDRTALRDLGRPWFFAAANDRVTMSPSRDATEAWLGDGGTLADDPWFAELAAAVDTFEPYTGVLVRGAFNFVPIGVVQSAEDLDAQEALVPEIAPFSHVAIAEFDDAGTPRTVVAYLFVDEGAANAAVDPLTEAWSNLRSFTDDDPSGRVVGATADASGRVLTLVLDAAENAETGFALALLGRREPVFTYR